MIRRRLHYRHGAAQKKPHLPAEHDADRDQDRQQQGDASEEGIPGEVVVPAGPIVGLDLQGKNQRLRQRMRIRHKGRSSRISLCHRVTLCRAVILTEIRGQKFGQIRGTKFGQTGVLYRRLLFRQLVRSSSSDRATRSTQRFTTQLGRAGSSRGGVGMVAPVRFLCELTHNKRPRLGRGPA